MHSPVDLAEETDLPAHIKNRMAFAVQKCAELADLKAVAQGQGADILAANAAVLAEAQAHADTVLAAVRERAAAVTPAMLARKSPFATRKQAQAWLRLPLLPTTTIGSFPQTDHIRKTRLAFKRGQMTQADYEAAIKAEWYKASVATHPWLDRFPATC